jgi:anti-anti-sigma factor
MTMAVRLIEPVGTLDAASGHGLKSEVIQAIADGSPSIVIDMSGVAFMDSSGFGALVMALKKAREAGSRLVLQDLNPQVRLVLELTGTDRVFEIVATGPEAAR